MAKGGKLRKRVPPRQGRSEEEERERNRGTTTNTDRAEERTGGPHIWDVLNQEGPLFVRPLP